MAFLFAGLLGPLIGSLFHHGSSDGSLDGASASLATTMENDSISSVMTRAQLSHRATQMQNLAAVADERVRESSMYNEFALSVEGADQNIIQKQMKLVDQATQSG